MNLIDSSFHKNNFDASLLNSENYSNRWNVIFYRSDVRLNGSILSFPPF